MKRSELLKLQDFARNYTGNHGWYESDEQYGYYQGQETVAESLKDVIEDFEITEEDVTLCTNGDKFVHELGYLHGCGPCQKFVEGRTKM